MYLKHKQIWRWSSSYTSISILPQWWHTLIMLSQGSGCDATEWQVAANCEPCAELQRANSKKLLCHNEFWATEVIVFTLEIMVTDTVVCPACKSLFVVFLLHIQSIPSEKKIISAHWISPGFLLKAQASLGAPAYTSFHTQQTIDNLEG